jgi:hypothetical protein
MVRHLALLSPSLRRWSAATLPQSRDPPPSSFSHRRHQQETPKPDCRRWRTAFPCALGGGSRLLLPDGGLARPFGSCECVVFDAAARSLAAERHGGAGGRWRLLGPDLGPFGPHLGRGGLTGFRVVTRLHGGEVRRR